MPAPSGSFLRATKPALWEPPQRAKNRVWEARHARPELSRKEGEGQQGAGAGFSLPGVTAALPDMALAMLGQRGGHRARRAADFRKGHSKEPLY